MCVGADDGHTLGSRFIDSTPLNKMLIGGLGLEIFCITLSSSKDAFLAD